MPRLFDGGSYVTGVGGGGGRVLVNVDDQQIGPAIAAAVAATLGVSPASIEGAGWVAVNDHLLAGQTCVNDGRGETCYTWTFDLDTHTLAGPFGAGAHRTYGRGGSVAWWLGGYGVYTRSGLVSAAGGLQAVSDAGEVIITPDYNQDRVGLAVLTPSGALKRSIATPGQVSGVFARYGRMLWNDLSSGRLAADGATAPVYTAGARTSGPFAPDHTGRFWIANQDERLILRAWDAPIGYVLSADGHDFWPDILPLGDGALRVVSSTNQGETEGTTRIYDIDPIAGTVSGNWRNGAIALVNLDTGAPASLPSPAPASVVAAVSQALSGPDRDDTLMAVAAIAAAAVAGYFISQR